MKDHILVNNTDKLFIIKFSNIVKITSNGSCSDIEDVEHSKFTVCKCLSKIYEELSFSHFVKVSQSCVINIKFLQVVDKKNKIIYLSNGDEIKYSITIKELVNNLIR